MKIMRYFMIWSCAIILGLCTNSCRKENFNFDKLDGIEASGEWGIPLSNAQYSVQQLLSQFKDNGYIEQEANGNLIFKYEIVKEELIKASDLMSFDDISSSDYFEYENNYPPNYPVELSYNSSVTFDNSQFEFNEGIVKTGSLEVILRNNIDRDYAITLTFPEIQRPNGEVLEIHLSSYAGHYSTRIDVSGYIIRASSTNEISYTGKIFFPANPGSSVTHYYIDCTFNVTDVSFKYISGRMAPQTIHMDEEMDLDFFSSNYGGTITVYNPTLELFTKNSFLINGQYIIDTAEFRSSQGGTSILSETPTYINFPPSPFGEHNSKVGNLSQVNLSTDFKSVNLNGRVVINPDGFAGGDLQIYDHSIISLRIVLTIPFTIKADYLFYRDTLDFNLGDISNINIVEYINFRLALTNGLPFDLNVQAYFYQSSTNTSVDSLFKSKLLLPGLYSSQTSAKEVVRFEEVTFSRLDKITKADKIILDFKMNTANNIVTLKNSHYLKAILGMKLKYDTHDVLISDIL